MKSKSLLIAVIILLTTAFNLTAQTTSANDNNQPKTVLLINAHLMISGRGPWEN